MQKTFGSRIQWQGPLPGPRASWSHVFERAPRSDGPGSRPAATIVISAETKAFYDEMIAYLRRDPAKIAVFAEAMGNHVPLDDPKLEDKRKFYVAALRLVVETPEEQRGNVSAYERKLQITLQKNDDLRCNIRSTMQYAPAAVEDSAPAAEAVARPAELGYILEEIRAPKTDGETNRLEEFIRNMRGSATRLHNELHQLPYTAGIQMSPRLLAAFTCDVEKLADQAGVLLNRTAELEGLLGHLRTKERRFDRIVGVVVTIITALCVWSTVQVMLHMRKERMQEERALQNPPAAVQKVPKAKPVGTTTPVPTISLPR